MLLATSRNAVEMLDEFGQYRSIARDVIVEVRLVTHLRNPTSRTMNCLPSKKRTCEGDQMFTNRRRGKPMAAPMTVTCGADECQT